MIKTGKGFEEAIVTIFSVATQANYINTLSQHVQQKNNFFPPTITAKYCTVAAIAATLFWIF